MVLNHGCRLAERGEFTKRAFINGRIDLTQAEAVMDIISSKTDSSYEISMNHLEGKLSEEINGMISEITKILANIEVNIDFPEYDEEKVTISQVEKISKKMIKKILK